MAMRKSAQEIALVMSALLEPALSNPAMPSFWLWERPDRAVISVNPNNLRNIRGVLSDQFSHDLSTRLGGCPVVRTNSLGVFFQVGYEARIRNRRLESVKLNLSEQPSPMHVPIGITRAGPLWISLIDADSVLIGGTRGFGKTMLLHGWIQALLQGRACRLVLWDGKSGNEFARYEGLGAEIAEELNGTLQDLVGEIARRAEKFREVGARDLVEYRLRHDDLQWIVLVVDEVAMIDSDGQDALAKLVATGRSYGILPVLATQRTSVQEVSGLVKANMGTRICFPVPAVSDSMVVLGRSGAEQLPKLKGRLLITWSARLVEAQAYSVSLFQDQSLPVGRDLQIARRAADEWAGVLSIPKLTDVLGWSEWRARKFLNEWYSRGWLVDGGHNTRRLSPAVLRSISQAHKPPQADLDPTSTRPQADSSQAQAASI